MRRGEIGADSDQGHEKNQKHQYTLAIATPYVKEQERPEPVKLLFQRKCPEMAEIPRAVGMQRIVGGHTQELGIIPDVKRCVRHLMTIDVDPSRARQNDDHRDVSIKRRPNPNAPFPTKGT